MRLAALDHPLRRARIRAGLSQQALAESSRVHHTQISRIENGLEPTEAELCRLAGVLGCAPADLLPARREVEP